MNKKKQNSKSQLPTALVTAFHVTPPPAPPLALTRLLVTPLAGGHAPPRSGATSRPYPPPLLDPCTRREPRSPTFRRGTLRTFSRVFPPYPRSHTPADVSPRPPREAATLALVLQPLSYRVVHARAASAVWAVVERTPPPGFCGLKIWLYLVLAFCFILTFLEFSRGRSAVEWRARARTCPQCTLGLGEQTHAPPRHRGKTPTQLGPLGAGRGPSTARPEVGQGGGLQSEWGTWLRSFSLGGCVLATRACARPQKGPGEEKPGVFNRVVAQLLQDSVQNAGEVKWKSDF